MIRFVTLCACLAMALGLFCLSPVSAAENRTLKVVMDDNYPPYIFRDGNGKLVGILVDQWELWGRKTGVRAEISAMDWADALTGMDAGHYDVIDTIFRNPERERKYDFSRPHSRLDVMIFFNRNISGITGLNSLKGFNVGAKRGDHAVTVLREAGVVNVTEYSSYESMIQAARERNLQIFIMDKPPALYLIYKNGLTDILRHTDPLYFGEFHRAVAKGDFQTLQLVESGFSQITQAEYDAISRKWFGSAAEPPGVDYRVRAAILGGVLLLALLLALWNWTLRRSVQRKTLALAASEKKFREMLMNLAIGVIVHDEQGIPTFWNMSALQQTGLTEDQLTGKEHFPPGWEYVSGEGERLDVENFPARLVLASGEPLRGYTIGIRQLARKTRWYQVDAFPDADSDGRIVQVVVTFFDITDRRESEEKLLFISFHDALTGVYNRAYFEEELRRLDSRHGGALAIAVADVDGMKRANDAWGHSKGDDLLIRAAELLSGSVRQEDVVARIGGDEFAVILRNADESAVGAIFDRLRQTMEKQQRSGDVDIPVSLSIGYSFAAAPGVSSEELFKEADNRMYQDKAKRGGNRI